LSRAISYVDSFLPEEYNFFSPKRKFEAIRPVNQHNSMSCLEEELSA
jgi:hypothetical protein